MLHEAQGDEHRRPRQIAGDRGGAAGDAVADDFGVADDLLAEAVTRRQLGLHHGLEQRPAQRAFELHAGARQHAGAGEFEHAVEHEEHGDDQRQHASVPTLRLVSTRS